MSGAVTWHDKLLRPGELPAWDRYVEEGGELGDVLSSFLQWQVRGWPRLAAAVQALDGIETREVDLGERSATVQWNPGRQASTTAKIDAASLERRPCFLCPRHQPPEERGLPFGEQLVVLPNPAPITPFHLVLALRDHVPQELGGCLEPALAFASATAGHLAVLYNGPLCGASAPDHLHLQAFAAGCSPDEGGLPSARTVVTRPGLRVRVDRGAYRQVFELSGTREQVAQGVREVVASVGGVLGSAGEPPVNLIIRGEGDGVRALVYPRGAHRPDCYTAEGDEQYLISPGALDMAGLVITVRRQDYERVDRALLGEIFGRTSLHAERADAVEQRLERRI